MRRSGLQRLVVLLAILTVLAAVWTAPQASDRPVAVLVPLWLPSPLVLVVHERPTAARCGEQPVSLLGLLPSRAPPAGSVLA